MYVRLYSVIKCAFVKIRLITATWFTASVHCFVFTFVFYNSENIYWALNICADTENSKVNKMVLALTYILNQYLYNDQMKQGYYLPATHGLSPLKFTPVCGDSCEILCLSLFYTQGNQVSTAGSKGNTGKSLDSSALFAKDGSFFVNA